MAKKRKVASALAGRTFIGEDIKGLTIDGINVAQAFEMLRRHRTAPGGHYYLTHKHDGTYVGANQSVARDGAGEVIE